MSQFDMEKYRSGRIHGCVHCDAKDMTIREFWRHMEINHPEKITRR